MKNFILTIIAVIIVGGIFGYYNYQRTTFDYDNNIPEGFFNDIGRVVIKNDQYDKLKEFMSGEYSSFLSGIEDKKLRDVTLIFDNAVESGNKEYFVNNKETIIDLEKSYQENKILQNLDTILSTGSRGNIDTNNDISTLLHDIINSRNIIKHLSWMMILRCDIEVNKDLCNQYQKITKDFITKTNRRASLVQSLINLVNIKYIIQQEKMSMTNINLCAERSNWKERYKQDMIDEFNTTFKIALKGIIDPLKEGIKKDTSIGEMTNNRSMNFISWAVDTTTLPDEINIQTYKKGQQGFYNVIEGKNKKEISDTAITKIFLIFIGIKTNYFVGDIISNILIQSLISKYDKIALRHQAIGELCKK